MNEFRLNRRYVGIAWGYWEFAVNEDRRCKAGFLVVLV